MVDLLDLRSAQGSERATTEVRSGRTGFSTIQDICCLIAGASRQMEAMRAAVAGCLLSLGVCERERARHTDGHEGDTRIPSIMNFK